MTSTDVKTSRRGDMASQILDVAEALVQTRGFNAFSYGDVAQELGCTKAALHYHFASKSELGEALLTRYAERFLEALKGIEAASQDGPTRLRGLRRPVSRCAPPDGACASAAFWRPSTPPSPSPCSKSSGTSSRPTRPGSPSVLLQGQQAGRLTFRRTSHGDSPASSSAASKEPCSSPNRSTTSNGSVLPPTI